VLSFDDSSGAGRVVENASPNQIADIKPARAAKTAPAGPTYITK
jgi:hypothetical protein